MPQDVIFADSRFHLIPYGTDAALKKTRKLEYPDGFYHFNVWPKLAEIAYHAMESAQE